MTTPRTPADLAADKARLGICPVCDNLFRQDGHAYDCPLAAGVRVEDEGGHGDIDERSLAHRSVYGDQVHIAVAWPNGERWEGLGDDGPSLVGDVTRALVSPAPPLDRERNGTLRTLDDALNSGDGTYRP